MTADPKIALYFALRWASTRPRVVRIRADALDAAAIVDVRSADAAAAAGLSPTACARTGGDLEVLYAAAVPPEAVDQPDPAMDDCSVLRVKWQRGRRRRDFVNALPASTVARVADMWMGVPEADQGAGRHALGTARGGVRRRVEEGGEARAKTEGARGIARGEGEDETEVERAEREAERDARGTARGEIESRKRRRGGGDDGAQAEEASGALGTARGEGADRAEPAPPDAWQLVGAEGRRERVVAGHVLVFTDGAGRHNQDANVRHAGSGAYWGPDHPYNVSVPVKGGATEQTNIRGELLAIVLAAERDARALEICTDSQWSIDRVRNDLAKWRAYGWRRSLNGGRPAHVDLWKRLDRQLADAARGPVRFRYVKGHATERDVAAGRVAAADKRGNDAADQLAVAGAAMHGVPRERIAAARRRVLVARAVQKLMLEVAWERARARERAEMPQDGGPEDAGEEEQPAADPTAEREPEGAEGAAATAPSGGQYGTIFSHGKKKNGENNRWLGRPFSLIPLQTLVPGLG
eukprot:gene19287-biopygen1903